MADDLIDDTPQLSDGEPASGVQRPHGFTEQPGDDFSDTSDDAPWRKRLRAANERANQEHPIEHHQCPWCNEFTAGPFKGHNPGYFASYVHEGVIYPGTPEGIREAEAAGATFAEHPTTGMCKKCRRNWLAKKRRIIHNREKQKQGPLEPPA